MDERNLACGVSGGPDSMALLWLLSRWAAVRDIRIHAVTVDHGLRPESAAEARTVGSRVERWQNVAHQVLIWDGQKPASRILEAAREARYQLLIKAAKEAGARYLFIAHHRDDQAETFLTRLAKGSGLDGLAGMNAVQSLGDIRIVRPLLDVPKDELIRICDVNGIPYVDDPSNENDKFLRPRLRGVSAALAREGLTTKRLSTTARRLRRARTALETLAGDLFDTALRQGSNDELSFDFKRLCAAPDELVLRVVLMAMAKLHPGSDYGPRLERVEDLTGRILAPHFRGATLGGCVFAIDAKNETLWIGKE